jgi:predicted lipid-binding transport protein (Tim44 family)
MQGRIGGKMAFVQIDHFLLNPNENDPGQDTHPLPARWSGRLGILSGLLMGMTAMSILLGQGVTGKPWMVLPRVIVLLTFGIISMILFRRGVEEEEENFN